MNKFLIWSLGAGGSFLFFIMSAAPTLALGLTPGQVTLIGVKSGSQIERTITVSRSRTELAEYYDIAVEGAGAVWVTAPPRVFLPVGHRSAPLTLTIAPPTGVVGKYQAQVAVRPTAEPSKTAGDVNEVGLSFSLAVSLAFTVVAEERRQLLIDNIFLEGAEAGGQFNVLFSLHNQGNILDGIDQLGIDFIDQTAPAVAYHYVAPLARETATAPFNDRAVKLPVALTAPAGQYLVRLQFISHNQVVAAKELTREFVPAPPFWQKIARGGGKKLRLIFAVGGAGALVLAAAAIQHYRTRAKKL